MLVVGCNGRADAMRFGDVQQAGIMGYGALSVLISAVGLG